MRPVLRALPATVASIVLGAHFLRDGEVVAAVAVAVAPLLLASRRGWSVRVVQGLLAAGVVVWLHTLVVLTALRRAQGEASLRMGLILFTVALVTALGAVLLEPLASHFRTARSGMKEA
ncbi:MAG: hypothetical protein HY899_10525 [Deltaproteobacteria bacterium]|nr:hypothetical protein [Deltaproteobacteria bacterium]